MRLIGGHWRGTRLSVPGVAGLRPTSDRVRETLFNWLMPVIHGARCLDLFAGSGALGFEAGSRGAARVLLLERDPALVASLRESAFRLKAESVEVRGVDAIAALEQDLGGVFDIVFIDPPFAGGLWQSVFERLPRQLAAQAWIYLEAPLQATPAVPADWVLQREGFTREVRYALYRRTALAAGLA